MTGAGRRHLFVGRGRELAELVALVDSAVLTRTPAVAVVVGEPGIGKSALFSRLAESVTGFRVLQVAGSSAVPALPFVAAEPLLRNLAGGQQSGSLAQLLAEPQQDSSLGTLRVIEAAYVAAARIGAVLVCVDDLQWVDESSIALLQSLIRGASTARLPLVVVAATRTGGIGEQRASTLMADLPSEQWRLLELRGLDDEAAGELAAALLGPARAASGPDVAARAAGSPFWIWQMASQPDSDDRSAVVTSRLRSATGDAAEVLALVAVAGRPVTPAELAELQGWPAERSAEAVERLRTLGLLTDELAGVRLAHDLWRSAVEQLLPAATKRRCHRQLARWLQERADGDVATVMEALGHATKAGDDPADLLPLVLGSPARRMVGQEGLRMLADVVTKSAPRHAAATATLATELGDELVAAPLWELAALSTSRRDRVAARLGAATTAYRLGREDATDLLQAARAELTREDVDLAATADALEASLLCWDRHRPQEALELVRTARHRLAAGVAVEPDRSPRGRARRSHRPRAGRRGHRLGAAASAGGRRGSPGPPSGRGGRGVVAHARRAVVGGGRLAGPAGAGGPPVHPARAGAGRAAPGRRGALPRGRPAGGSGQTGRGAGVGVPVRRSVVPGGEHVAQARAVAGPAPRPVAGGTA